jgi:hypothetical protein
LVSIDRSCNPLHFRLFLKILGLLNFKNCLDLLKNFSRGRIESRGVHGKKRNTSVLIVQFLGISGMPHSAIIIIDTTHESRPPSLAIVQYL